MKELACSFVWSAIGDEAAGPEGSGFSSQVPGVDHPRLPPADAGPARGPRRRDQQRGPVGPLTASARRDNVLAVGASRRFIGAVAAASMVVSTMAAPALAFHRDPALAPEPPFVVCEDQRYALCAAATCFVYNGVAYCDCVIMKGDSISLQLEFDSGTGPENVCDVNAQGQKNGYMVSTFSLPEAVLKGGSSAVYTCPGDENKGGGVAAPVAYGQCDGGLCFTSTKGKTFPGLDKLSSSDLICSCPISTDSTKGSANAFGYQIFGPYRPEAPRGARCDAGACAGCSVGHPTANGSIIPVGAPTGTGKFLSLRLAGPPVPDINECLCTCAKDSGTGETVCTVAEDLTPTGR